MPVVPRCAWLPAENHAGKTYLSNWPKSYANFSVRPLPGPVMARFWRFDHPLGGQYRVAFASLSRYNNQKEVIHHVQDRNNQYAHRTDNQSAS